MTPPAANDAEQRWMLLALAGFAAVLALLIAHHEMWRDELQAWLLARDSGSLAMLWQNSRYEGHPLLWHLMLYPLAHLAAGPQAMQVLHWAIAVGVAALVLLRSPFPAWGRVLLVFSYFPLYEYGTISRNYALTVLGLWLAFAALARRRSPLAVAAGGALAANASPMGLVLAPAVGAALWLGGAPRRSRLAAVGLLAAAAGAGALQCLPPADYEHARAWVFGWEPVRAAYVGRGLAAALLPVPGWGLHFWGSSAIFRGVEPGHPPAPGAVAAGVLLLAAVVAVALVVRRSRAALVSWVLGVASLLAFAYVKFPGALRHWGFVWVLLVGVLWLAVGDGGVTRRAATLVLAPTLLAGLAGSFVGGWWEWRAPFSAARCAASELRRLGLDRLPLVGGVDWASSGVAAYLPNGRVFYPASGREGSFIVWNLARTRQDRLGAADIVREAAALDRGAGVVVLLNEPLAAPAALGCRAAFGCAPTIVPDESLFGYVCYGAR